MADTPAPTALARLEQELARLPGIGRRSAQRMAFHLLKAQREEAEALADAILELKRRVRHCVRCFNLCEDEYCDVCLDHRRDAALVMVVEQPADLATIEATSQYNGRYHVLMGRLSPLDGVGPGELNIDPLLERVRSESLREVILATNPTLEGDGTALFLSEALASRGVKVSRLARGLPTGVNLEVVSKAVLSDAIHGRREVM